MVDASIVGYVKGHEEFFIGQVPYLFDTLEDAARIYNSEVFAPLYERLRKEKGSAPWPLPGTSKDDA